MHPKYKIQDTGWYALAESYLISDASVNVYLSVARSANDVAAAFYERGSMRSGNFVVVRAQDLFVYNIPEPKPVIIRQRLI